MARKTAASAPSYTHNLLTALSWKPIEEKFLSPFIFEFPLILEWVM